MNFTLKRRATMALKGAALLLALVATSSCEQQKTEQEEATAATKPETTLVAEKRPAPTFFIIPEELAKKRVWILENGQADIFHLKHDCPVLIEGKGKGTFKNVTLTRAIEEYGRYNCQVCSKELDHIFDVDMIRMSN